MLLKKAVRELRSRNMLGIIALLHLKSIHQIRNFSIANYMSGAVGENKPFEAFESLADAHRDVLADILELSKEKLHCTIKLIEVDGNEDNKEEWKVFTIARSTPCNRPVEYGPDIHHKVGHNSSFAPLVGCNDRKNTWSPNAYTCFSCDNLTERIDNYDNSRPYWHNYYKSTIVFPIRYRRGSFSRVIGFLTFDSPDVKVFSNIPDIFQYRDKPDDYAELLSLSSAFHLGAIVADTLATTFYLNNEVNSQEVYNGKVRQD